MAAALADRAEAAAAADGAEAFARQGYRIVRSCIPQHELAALRASYERLVDVAKVSSPLPLKKVRSSPTSTYITVVGRWTNLKVARKAHGTRAVGEL